ncbi:hypothetical protein SDC9_66298 [bioreactor metagenome]|uniref:Uncharacterized protein n=1 Tax=bioreactor metagenome TaxID=1076179 RepID=A0A644XW30_9ZZZZ
MRLSEDITTGTELLQYITLSKSMTLDFAGFTIHYKATGTDINHINGLFHSSSGVTLTPKGTGGVTFAGNYSSLAQVNPGGKIIVGAVLIRMQPKPKAA